MRSTVFLRATVSVLIAASSALLPVPAGAQDDAEEILAYDVRIEVGAGGVMLVTESIEVRALGQVIRRGIYRDFPTTFPREESGGEIVAPFRVIGVTRDGRSESHTIERIMGPGGRGGIRVRIGDPNVFLAEGVYAYSLVYETERWLQFGESEDELYWNVTGNGWEFPIRSASAAISLPGDLSPQDVGLEAWTGPDGSVLQDAVWRWEPGRDEALFETTRPLGALEGLTVRLRFPSGVVDRPSPEQHATWFRLDWGGYVDAGAVVGLLLALYSFMWIRVGRDPPSRTIMVQYGPPEGFSPAALGFLRERGYEPAQLNAALVSLAVKGAITIEKDGSKWEIRSTEERREELSRDEERLYDELMGKASTLTLSGTPNVKLRKALKDFRKTLKRQLEKHYFVTNRGWFLWGLGISIAGLAVLAWRVRFSVSAEIWFLGFWLAFWTLGVSTLLYRTYLSWAQALSGDVLAGAGAVFITLFSIPFVAAEVFVGWWLYRGAPGHLIAAAVAVGVLNVLFYHLLERPTLKGRGVLDALEGFRRYLGAAEEDVFDRLQPPEASLELFERYLPYAIALDVDNHWAERFERALTAADREAVASGNSLTWYSAGRGSARDLAGVTSSLRSSFSSSLSASSASPSSGGGGGGGGGSSGGGGGGGGGGGW